MEKIKVLLVDDDQNILETIGTRIRSWDYDLLTASDGNQALEVINNKNPDIVVLDYRMPDKDGIATLIEIRKVDNDVPVIMFTAYPDEKSIKGTEGLGVIAFIPKVSDYSDSQTALSAALAMAVKTKVKDR